MTKEDDDELYLLMDSLERVIEIDKKMIDKFAKGFTELKAVFTLDEINAIREILCIDLDSAKRRLKKLEEDICNDDEELRRLFGLDIGDA
jgi:hypothetical protein